MTDMIQGLKDDDIEAVGGPITTLSADPDSQDADGTDTADGTDEADGTDGTDAADQADGTDGSDVDGTDS